MDRCAPRGQQSYGWTWTTVDRGEIFYSLARTSPAAESVSIVSAVAEQRRWSHRGIDAAGFFTSPPGRGARHCDECVCLYICRSVRWHISKNTCPNFKKISIGLYVEINRVVLIICKFSHFTILPCKCLFTPLKWVFGGIWPPKWEMVATGSTKGISLHRNTSYDVMIVEIGQKWQKYNNFSIFSRWRPSAILDLWNAYLDHPQTVLCGLYHCAKFGWNRRRSFGNMQVLLFYHFGYFTPPKWRFLGHLTPKMGSQIKETQKGTSFDEAASFEPTRIKIGGWVWPVEVMSKKGIHK